MLCRQLGEFGKLLSDLLFDAKVDAALLAIGFSQIHFLHEIETVCCAVQHAGAFGCCPLQFGIGNMQRRIAGKDQGVLANRGLPDILSDFPVLPEQFGRYAAFKAILMQIAAAFINHIQIAVTYQTQAERSFQVSVAVGIRRVVKPFHATVTQWQ
ncbi:hypothetical protein A988_02823 [Pseudomonas syringae BRIP39023]|nr:hypothetical protein PSYRMG_11150 [Pseudomonas syringae UMAF0158]ELQ14251.1 hypothetical protein A988_02823 [Pseudomonas syringae BRIP39023]